MGASPRAVDWDEDGDFDLLSGEYNGYVTLFQNIGTPTNPILHNAGRIKANSTDIDVGNLSVPDVNDWDEDGRKDLIIGCDAGNVYVYLNTGTNAAPAFQSSFKIQANGTNISHIKNCPRIADMNEDGLKDLVLAWIDGTCLYWPNQGTNAAPVFRGKYTLNDYQGSLDPTLGAYNWSHFGVCDWNEDGHLDLLYTRWESEIRLHLSGAHKLVCTVAPTTPPVVIPPDGGSIDYDVTLNNQSGEDVVLDAWTEIRLPDGTYHGPVRIVGTDLTIPAGGTQNYTFKDAVPGTFPASDDYLFRICMGDMGNGYYSADGFTFSKKDYLSAGPTTIPEAGGAVDFDLWAGPNNGSRNYLLLGSVTGTSPGTTLPGGMATLPLNWDAFTGLVVTYANTPIFKDFMGVLDSNGAASAKLSLGPVPGFAGTLLYFAYAMNMPWDFASNPVQIEIVP